MRPCAMPYASGGASMKTDDLIDLLARGPVAVDARGSDRLWGRATVLGGIADSVHEVIELAPAQIAPPPTIAMRWRSEFIQGMGKRGDEFIILLGIDAVFASDAQALVAETAGIAEPSAAR